MGYEYRGHGFVKQQADPSGRLWLPVFELWIGLENGQAVLYDKNGIVPDPQGSAEQAEQAKSDLEAEKIRADSAEARMRELEAELTRLKRP